MSFCSAIAYKKMCKGSPWMNFHEWMAYIKEMAEVSLSLTFDNLIKHLQSIEVTQFPVANTMHFYGAISTIMRVA
jgi:hypothetical protein